jgi:hypothetical protein
MREMPMERTTVAPDPFVTGLCALLLRITACASVHITVMHIGEGLCCPTAPVVSIEGRSSRTPDGLWLLFAALLFCHRYVAILQLHFAVLISCSREVWHAENQT